MKTMKKTIQMILMVVAISVMPMCKKSKTQPNEPEAAQHTTQSPSNQKVVDTTMIGTYQMVTSSISSELNTTIKLKLSYESNYIDYSSNDTINARVWLRVVDNMNFTAGYTKVSKNITFNDAFTHADAKICVYSKNIGSGFYGDNALGLYPGSNFSADTMSLNFTVNPAVGNSYNVVFKYKKI